MLSGGDGHCEQPSVKLRTGGRQAIKPRVSQPDQWDLFQPKPFSLLSFVVSSFSSGNDGNDNDSE